MIKQFVAISLLVFASYAACAEGSTTAEKDPDCGTLKNDLKVMHDKLADVYVRCGEGGGRQALGEQQAKEHLKLLDEKVDAACTNVSNGIDQFKHSLTFSSSSIGVTGQALVDAGNKRKQFANTAETAFGSCQGKSSEAKAESENEVANYWYNNPFQNPNNGWVGIAGDKKTKAKYQNCEDGKTYYKESAKVFSKDAQDLASICQTKQNDAKGEETSAQSMIASGQPMAQPSMPADTKNSAPAVAQVKPAVTAPAATGDTLPAPALATAGAQPNPAPIPPLSPPSSPAAGAASASVPGQPAPTPQPSPSTAPAASAGLTKTQQVLIIGGAAAVVGVGAYAIAKSSGGGSSKKSNSPSGRVTASSVATSNAVVASNSSTGATQSAPDKATQAKIAQCKFPKYASTPFCARRKNLAADPLLK